MKFETFLSFPLTKYLKQAAFLCLLVCTGFSTADVKWVDATYQVVGDNAELVGIGLYKFNDNKLGTYASLSLDVPKFPSYRNLTTTTYGDPVIATFQAPYVLNIGKTKTLLPFLGWYAGVGVVYNHGRAEMYDPSMVLSSDGYYYVSNSAQNDFDYNVNLGAMLSLGRLSLNAGYNLFNQSGYVGLGLRIGKN